MYGPLNPDYVDILFDDVYSMDGYYNENLYQLRDKPLQVEFTVRTKDDYGMIKPEVVEYESETVPKDFYSVHPFYIPPNTDARIKIPSLTRGVTFGSEGIDAIYDVSAYDLDLRDFREYTKRLMTKDAEKTYVEKDRSEFRNRWGTVKDYKGRDIPVPGVPFGESSDYYYSNQRLLNPADIVDVEQTGPVRIEVGFYNGSEADMDVLWAGFRYGNGKNQVDVEGLRYETRTTIPPFESGEVVVEGYPDYFKDLSKYDMLGPQFQLVVRDKNVEPNARFERALLEYSYRVTYEDRVSPYKDELEWGEVPPGYEEY